MDTFVNNESGQGINKDAETLESNEISDFGPYWVPYIFTPVLFIIGGICNILSIKIFIKRSMRSSTNIYLTALAMSDLFYQIFSFVMSWKYYNIMENVWLYWWYTPFGLWLAEASGATSVWIIVSFTVERYIAVCHPLKRPIYCTTKRAMIVSSIVFLISFTYTGTFSYEWRGSIEPVKGTPLNETVYILDSTEAWKAEKFQTIYYWTSTVYFFVIPVLMITTFSYFIVQFVLNTRRAPPTLNSVARHRVPISQWQRNDKRVTKTVVAVGMTYILCQLPTNLLAIYNLVYKPTAGSTEERNLMELRNILKLVGRVDSTCNVLLYIALSMNYRKYLYAMCCPQRVRKDNGNLVRPPRVCGRAGFPPVVEIHNIRNGLR